MKVLLTQFSGRLLVFVRALGPYAAIELLLPGGTVLAVLYWWWQRHRARQARVISQCGTRDEVQPFSEPLRLELQGAGEAVSLANRRSDVSPLIESGHPSATSGSSYLDLAA